MTRRKTAHTDTVVSAEAKPAKRAPATNPKAAAATHKRPSTKAVIAEPVIATTPDRDEIAKLAYFFWASRGFQSGSPEEDWLRAERELVSTRRTKSG